MSEKQTFHDIFSKLLLEKLKPITQKNVSLDLASCVEIYTMVFNTLVDVFQASNVKLTNESVNYVAQCYYDGIVINDGHYLDPNIFTQRAKLENISSDELALLAVMLKGTGFIASIVLELKRR
jgi:hypothetical protein